MIRARDLGLIATVRHGFFTREGGVSEGVYASLNCGLGTGDDEARVAENRARAMAALGLGPSRLCTPYQTHGAAVKVVEEPWPWDERPRADAMVTTVPGIALGVLTADCAPVLLADSETGVVSAVHAGWKGALAGVIEAAVEAMAGLGAEPGRITAAIGPCIGHQSYEVGPEFPDPFLADDPGNGRFFAPAPRDGRFRFDLVEYIAARLAAAGVAQAQRLGHDTVGEDALFFSYRRARLLGESDYGCALSAIALVA